MRENLPSNVPISEHALQASLRGVMDEIAAYRNAQIAASIHNPDYDAATAKITDRFLRGFCGILPIEPCFTLLPDRTSYSHAMVVKGGVSNLRVAASYSVSASVPGNVHDQTRTRICIGERGNTTTRSRIGLTDLLLLGWKHEIVEVADMSDNERSDFVGRVSPSVDRITVVADRWAKIIDRQRELLVQPFPPEIARSLHSSEHGGYVMSYRCSDNEIPLIYSGVEYPTKNRYGARRLKSIKPAGVERSMSTPFVSAQLHTDLVTSDFANFNVVPRMREVAAAFRVGDRLERLLHNREKSMPAHPAATQLGYSDLRPTFERAKES